MEFSGFQKLTLLDYPGKVACTLFTAGCNFRCPFCHNASLVLMPAQNEHHDQEEILAFLGKRKGVLDGVCITGGEPLLHPELPAFLRKVRQIGLSVKLDTNGSFPDRLKTLVREGLVNYVAMDIKNSPANYAKTAAIPGLDLAPIRESAAFLMEGTVAYEFRTTLVRELHTSQDLLAIAEWIRGESNWFLQGFQDSGNLIAPGLHGFDGEETKAFADLVKPLVPHTYIRGLD